MRSFRSNYMKISKVFIIVSIMMSLGLVAFGQGTRGTVRGTVTDQNQAVIPNAKVELIDAQRGTVVRTATTADNGTYQFVEIEPANYNLVVTAPNFSEYKVSNFKVEPNRNLELNAALSVGGASAEVTVTAGVELIDKESSALGTTVDTKRIEVLPLNGRNILDLAALQPGVTTGAGGTGIRSNGSRSTENNVTLDGGNNNEVATGGTIGGQPRPDAVQEFRLLTSNFEAEFGRNTGSVINVVTKSGTNEYHGNARLFYRPTSYSSARFLAKALAPASQAGADLRDPFERKEYGFNIGGPVYLPSFGEGGPMVYNGKDRTFFFVDYERRWQKIAGSSTINNLPTTAQKAGDFSAFLIPGLPLCSTLAPTAAAAARPSGLFLGNTANPPTCSTEIFDPLTATAANPRGTPFANNIIPTNRITAIGRYYTDFLPDPTAGFSTQVAGDNLTINDYLTMRFDHNINPQHLLNFTFNYFKSDDESAFAFQGPPLLGFGSANRRNTKNYIGRYTWVMSSNKVNTLLLNYSKNDQPGVAPVNTTTPAEIGFTGNFVANPQFAGPPNIRLYDRGLQIGNTIQGPQARVSENLQFQDSFSWIVGSHRMKFGVDATIYRQHQDFLFVNQGILGFSADGEPGSNSVGNDFADLLLGTSPLTIQVGANGQRDFRQHGYSFFAQDTWNVSSNLTVTAGIRYEYVSPLTDSQNRVAYYRLGATSALLASGTLKFGDQTITIPTGGRAPNGLVYVGDPDPVLGGTVPEGGVKPDRNNFAPRIGVSYAINGSNGFWKRLTGENSSVIRAGFGMFYGALIGNNILQQLSAPGYNGTNAYYYRASGTLADPWANDPYPFYSYSPFLPIETKGVPTSVPNPFAATNILVGAPLAQFSTPLNPNMTTPIVYQWNATFERSFASDYVFGISYVGNSGRKLYGTRQVNPALGTLITGTRPQPLPAANGSNANNRRLNDDVRIGLAALDTIGTSDYHSMQANFQKRFSNDGLLFQAAYTFSKSLNTGDGFTSLHDYFDINYGRARSDDDRPHRFVGSIVYELPFFRNTTGIVNRLVDGWSIGAIYTYQSGGVFHVLNPTDVDGTGGAILTYLGYNEAYTQLDPRENDRRAFNVDAFQNPVTCPTATYATCARRLDGGRNMFRLNNITNNWDFIVAKKFRLFNERNNLELRFEAFNALNTAQFTTINVTRTSADFGRYTGTRDPRSIQLAARFNF